MAEHGALAVPRFSEHDTILLTFEPVEQLSARLKTVQSPTLDGDASALSGRATVPASWKVLRFRTERW